VSLRDRPLGSTYRLQLNGFGLRKAMDLVDYLNDLGVETLYASPLTAATSGSTHGYDVVDPTRIDPALGTAEDLEALLALLDSHAMRLLVDIVPNHMSTSTENSWWSDVLRRGVRSEFARFFDIDWEAGDGRVVLPVLGKPFGETLEGGELQIEPNGAIPCVRYGDVMFPLSPESCEEFGLSAGEILGGLTPTTGDPHSFDALEELLDAQHYRLAYWELAPHLVNYRRFFDINGLVGVRVEDPVVYSRAHGLVRELARDPRIAGVRVDHVDGLADPAEYLERLSTDLAAARTTDGGGDRPAILVEKILARNEELPRWPVGGTTGYEFADLVIGLLTDQKGALNLEELAPEPLIAFGALAVAARRQVLEEAFPGQVHRLAKMVVRAASADRHGRDLAVADVRHAIVELTAHMAVYRSYIEATEPPSASDRKVVEDAARAAGVHLDHHPGTRALEIVRRMLLSIPLGPDSGPYAAPTSSAWVCFTVAWQQLASAVAAKGVEDTGLYRFCGLLSSADVGSDPSEPSVSVESFHMAMEDRASVLSGSLNGTSTHDSKRSEDVRARVAVLSEIPQRFAGLVDSWRDRHLPLWRRPIRSDASTPDFDMALYQTIVGAWPLRSEEIPDLTARVQGYMQKAVREAKVLTSWTHPNAEYERALHLFVQDVVDPANHQFLQEIEGLVEDIGRAGATNSLALTILKVAAPGVPDFYQGTEVWSPLLVDPDNRRPVDFVGLRKTLSSLRRGDQPGAERALGDWRDGALKMLVIRAALQARRNARDLFARGEYIPVQVRGRFSRHVVSFARRFETLWAVAVVPRGVMSVAGHRAWPVGEVWADTELSLPPGAPRSLVGVLGEHSFSTGSGALQVSEVLSALPVALLLGHN
jgi:(1->4)-alpha-D-glucan 1-alpha-D-glucosylmutase